MEANKGDSNSRLNTILEELQSGKSREKIASELGYKSYKSLDIFMRRKKYLYDKKQKCYVKELKENKAIEKDKPANVSAKAAAIIKMFKTEDADPRAIAKQMKFQSHNEMASYMKARGFIWDNEKKNYIQKSILQNEHSEEAAICIESEIDKSPEDFNDLLRILEENKEKFMELLSSGFCSSKIPRYILPGVFITKSVHMSNNLDLLVKEFSQEKNISQREIFEVALIDFFTKYGYLKEISTLLEM